jgi:tRNA(fMet)-specific endonuclease VapC
MKSYLLDTNHLSPLVTYGHPLRKRILEQAVVGDAFAITPLVVCEFIFGISTLSRVNQNFDEWRKLRDDFVFFSLNLKQCEDAADLRVALRRRGRQISIADSMNAIVALTEDLILLTTDRDYEAIPNLKIENWVA